jgi:hypothetical protein
MAACFRYVKASLDGLYFYVGLVLAKSKWVVFYKPASL